MLYLTLFLVQGLGLCTVDIVVQRFFQHLLSHTIGVQAMNVLTDLTDMFDGIRKFRYDGPTVPANLIVPSALIASLLSPNILALVPHLALPRSAR